MDLCRTVTEINGDSVKNRKFSPTPVYFAPQLNVFPSELGTDAGSQKTGMMGLPGRLKSLTISSSVWLQSTNVSGRQTSGRTDGQTSTGRQQRPRLHIASRNKDIIPLNYMITCPLAVVKRSQKFPPPQTPISGGGDGQNLISWRWSLPSPTNPVS